MRCKLRVWAINDQKNTDGDKVSEQVKFSAVASSDPESDNAKWAKYTPIADFSMQIDNPGAFDHFTIGQEVFVDINPVS